MTNCITILLLVRRDWEGETYSETYYFAAHDISVYNSNESAKREPRVCSKLL